MEGRNLHQKVYLETYMLTRQTDPHADARKEKTEPYTEETTCYFRPKCPLQTSIRLLVPLKCLRSQPIAYLCPTRSPSIPFFLLQSTVFFYKTMFAHFFLVQFQWTLM